MKRRHTLLKEELEEWPEEAEAAESAKTGCQTEYAPVPLVPVAPAPVVPALKSVSFPEQLVTGPTPSSSRPGYCYNEHN
jgi:hypothetical protein